MAKISSELIKQNYREHLKSITEQIELRKSIIARNCKSISDIQFDADRRIAEIRQFSSDAEKEMLQYQGQFAIIGELIKELDEFPTCESTKLKIEEND